MVVERCFYHKFHSWVDGTSLIVRPMGFQTLPKLGKKILVEDGFLKGLLRLSKWQFLPRTRVGYLVKKDDGWRRFPTTMFHRVIWHYLHSPCMRFQTLLTSWDQKLVERCFLHRLLSQRWVYCTMLITSHESSNTSISVKPSLSERSPPQQSCFRGLSILLFPCRSCLGFQILTL